MAHILQSAKRQALPAAGRLLPHVRSLMLSLTGSTGSAGCCEADGRAAVAGSRGRTARWDAKRAPGTVGESDRGESILRGNRRQVPVPIDETAFPRHAASPARDWRGAVS